MLFDIFAVHHLLYKETIFYKFYTKLQYKFSARLDTGVPACSPFVLSNNRNNIEDREVKEKSYMTNNLKKCQTISHKLLFKTHQNSASVRKGNSIIQVFIERNQQHQVNDLYTIKRKLIIALFVNAFITIYLFRNLLTFFSITLDFLLKDN